MKAEFEGITLEGTPEEIAKAISEYKRLGSPHPREIDNIGISREWFKHPFRDRMGLRTYC